VNAPNLSRRLASRIVEGLKGRGRILVVKGGTAALVRVVDDALSGEVERLAKTTGRSGEPATTEALARLSSRVAQALLASEHLEDVFADRSVVEREVLEAARAALEEARASEDEALVRVEIDLLGYVAATAGKRARAETITDALVRAGEAVGATLESYDATAREAVFAPEPPAHPDLRLELEEAVADELCALVQRGAVELPTLERTVALKHEVSPSERARLARFIDRAATRTLRRTGCSARWEIPDDRSLRVIFTPLSEQDAREVDLHVASFASEVDTLLEDAGAPIAREPAAEPAPAAEEEEAASEQNGPAPASVEPEVEDAELAKAGRARSTKRATRSPSRPSTTVRATTKKRAAAPKRATTKRAKASAEDAPRAKKAATTGTKRARPATTKGRTAKKR